MTGAVTASTIFAGIGAASSLIGALSGKKSGGAPAPAPAPVLEKPAVMPIADEEAAAQKRRMQMSNAAAQRGRASTILSEDTGADRLGG